MSSGAGSRPALRPGFVLGIALMGAVDEIVFHQLLQWHNFYVHAAEFWRVFSDGLFHGFTVVMWMLGASMLWYQRARLATFAGDRFFWSALLLGMGGFQLFDGVINHKVLGLHPVRVGLVSIWPYDVAWIASALLLLSVGWTLHRSARPP